MIKSNMTSQLMETTSQPTHESSALNLKWILITTGALAVLLMGIALGLWGLIAIYDSGFENKAEVSEYLQSYRQADELNYHWNYQQLYLQEHQRIMRERLHRYEWIDRERGIVRIPIERAMEIVAKNSEHDNK
ncbi:MAG: hypothetical protein ACOX5R_09340 [bacterium]|jgi:hypothetical protein